MESIGEMSLKDLRIFVGNVQIRLCLFSFL